MSLIKINNLYYSSVKPLFENVTFSLDTNWKTAIIGRNRVGKSTIFKLLLGEVDYEGTISKSVECEKFPFVIPINNKDKNAIELFNIHSPSTQEWKFFKETSLLELNENLLFQPFKTLSKGERAKILLAILFTKNGFYY
ncbi:ATP-binding cassette domain-containing protein [Actinomyces sp. zg-332]|uniref:ATP-binding cassette domain-containing protein n=1 Tax=Actinomyces sp. zg-332 TaxID=2708340 RepID=UPI00141E1C90|nr:ATP-binding cassette domain-containing protein [Actinomyces sp. zg-332]QPK94130.1 ATP-binding cassette domain-containing protein [Actinomyces sp. zg-332]